MASFGLDIGSESIKIVQLTKEGDKFRLVGAGMVKTPENGLTSEAEKDLVAVAEAIKKLKKEAGIAPNQVVLSLPERGVFTKIIDLPAMNEEEVNQALRWELEEVIPIPLSEANYDWQIIRRDSAKTSVLVAVAPKTLISKYLHLLELAELQPVAFETEVLAIVRALITKDEPKAKLIVDFGSKSTNIIVVKQDQIILTRSIPTAGEAITRAISSSLDLEKGVAEEYKKTYGLSEEEFEGKIAQAITPILETGISEIKRSLNFCKENREEVGLIVLCGGTANLPGLSETITNRTGLEVQIADPFQRLIFEKEMVNDLRKFASNFVIAIGLAMRGV